MDRLGIFMGADRQADSESVTFMRINETIMHQCGAFWSEPMSAHFLLAQPDSQQVLAASAREALAAQMQDFMGNSDWRSNMEEMQAFGWKDPRNTFTLPVWRQVFPNLKTIHIVRHGVDVAASLARRHATALREATGESAPSALTVIRDHALGVLSSRRGWTLAEALTMWEQYVEKARIESAGLQGRALEIRFEDLLMQPQLVVPQIAQFCGVPVPKEGGAVFDLIESGRAFAFRRDPQLAAFAENVPAILARYGYTP
jgi:hypothetical protein